NFYILAQEDTRNFVSSTKLLQTKLDALAKFVSTSETLSEEKFQYYCQAFSDNLLVWAWNWIPEVAEADRSRFVAAARAGGMTGYGIWERDTTGGRRSSPKRAVYYPILYAAPAETGGESAGFDMASEIRRKTAVEAAIATSLAIASDPIPLLFDNSGVIGFLVIHSMIRPNSKIPAGVVTAAIRGDSLYRSYSNSRDILHTNIFLYNSTGRPQRLAVNGKAGRRHLLDEEAPFVRPVLAFGKVFILNVKPGLGYKHSCSTLTSLGVVALAGLAFTIAVAMVVALICRRRTELQRLVKERTLKLNESERRFAMLAKDSRTVLWEIDKLGFFTYIDPVCQDIYGYAPEELLNRKRFFDLHPVEGRDRFIEETRKMIAVRQHFIDFIHPIATRDGAILIVSGNGVPILDEDGTLIGYHGFDKDVTERERINQELRDSKQAAEAASQAKTEFLAHMSHEIRTPLNGVIGMTDLLRESGLDADQRHFVEIIGSNGKLLLSVVNDILDFSQIEEGKVKLDPVDFNLDDFLSELSGSLAYQARQKNLELILAIALDVPSIINGDSLRLRQVIINLANNAIKFTEKGEVRISVAVECETEKEVLLRFRVNDTGIGIGPKQMPYLFDPFFQGDSSVKRKYGGTGLGLPISKRLVECMGGTMKFTSRQGVGSEFTFTVPFQTRACINTASALYDPWHDAKVLVLGDHSAWRDILSGYLSALSLRPITAGDSAAAVELLRQAAADRDPFRLVLVDCGMSPSEIEFLIRTVEAEPEAARPQLLALLPIGRRLEEIGGKWAGIINKPFSRKDLISRIGNLSQAVPNPVPAPPPVAVKPTPGQLPLPGTDGSADILLVEDNRTNQMVAQLMLKKLGLRIEIAGNGHDALRLLAEKTYKAVLMDVQMPGMDGLEATRRIRADESPVLNRRIPVIAMTAHALSEYQEMCTEAGMDDYITKPFTVKQFHNVLSRWILLGELPGS
ncbi:MAG: response regulator, partial [Victivallaceae bacterium]